MRPGDFSPGNGRPGALRSSWCRLQASMRPGDFSPGNGDLKAGKAAIAELQ